MKNVYGYTRVSTLKQGEGVSLIEQKEAIIRYANQYSLNIIQWFEEKETAAKQGRPLFDAMMKLLKDKKAIGVIIHKIDRSARNLKDWADLGNLIDQGVEVHFAHESLDLQARGGRLSADIQAVIAADYIRNLRDETKKGIYGRLKQGIYPFSAPTGYVNTGSGKYKTIDLVQGPLVRKAFELYAKKEHTLKSLTVHMHGIGLRNSKQRKISKNGLAVILNNPFYVGILRVNGMNFDGGHEPLISPALFHQVQAIMRNSTNQRIKKHLFKFRKLLSCQSCGYTMIAETQKGHVYYRCHTQGCITKGMREVTIENFLCKAFTASQLYSEESVLLEELLLEMEKEWLSKRTDLLNSLKLQTGQIQQKLERLTDCYVEGGLDKETFEQRKEKLLYESKNSKIAETKIQQEQDKTLVRVKKFLELAKDLKKSYETEIFENQREFVESVTSNLVVSGKKLTIAMKSPFEELSKRYEFSSSSLERDTCRTVHTQICYSEQNTSPIMGEPLNKEQLKSLLDMIVSAVSQLPDSNNETDYAI